jgi:hypothetical protein
MLHLSWKKYCGEEQSTSKLHLYQQTAIRSVLDALLTCASVGVEQAFQKSSSAGKFQKVPEKPYYTLTGQHNCVTRSLRIELDS